MKLEVLNALDAKTLLKEVKAGSEKLVIASHLARLKIPNKKSEKYRYFDIESIIKKDFNVVTTKESDFKKEGTKLIIKDGTVVQVPDISGVSVEIANFSDVDNDHFDALYYASHLIANKAVKVVISSDARFEIEHIFSKENSLIDYRVALFLNANTHATVYESFGGSAEGSVVISGYDIFVSRDANLNFIKNQTLNENTHIPIFSNFYKVDSSAVMKLATFDFLSENSLNIFKTELSKDANFNATHLLYTNGDIKGGTVSETVHIGQNSKSEQNAKNILNNSSRGIFDALIRVTNSAKGTIAHQNSKAILLNSGAYMASKPQLEIYIDELEASHGSTTGQLDKKQLFYLRSRGIKEVDARKMLILAFANEAIATVEDESFSNHIYVDFEKAYYGSAELDCIKSCHGCEDLVLGDSSEND